MQNPWHDLPSKEPFVLPSDKASIRPINALAKPEYRIRLEFLPEPYLGNPRANIVLLNGNPGVKEEDRSYHDRADFAKANRATLLHESQEYPFYLLDPRFEGAPGYKWWYPRLQALFAQFSVKKIANEIFVIEYFPYHSENFQFSKDHLKKFGIGKGVLSSQEYSFYLLEEAMKRDALIILLRKKREWQSVNPCLEEYPRYYELKREYRQSAVISSASVDDGGYLEIVRELKKQ